MDLLTLYGILNKSSGGDVSTVIANILNEVFDTEEYTGKTLEELKTIIADLSSGGDVTQIIDGVNVTVSEDGFSYYDEEKEADILFSLKMINEKPVIEYEILGGEENE